MNRDEAEAAAQRGADIKCEGLTGTILECQGILAVVRWDDGKHSMLPWERIELAGSSRSGTRAKTSLKPPDTSGTYKVEVLRGRKWQTLLADADHKRAAEFAEFTERTGKRVRILKTGG